MKLDYHSRHDLLVERLVRYSISANAVHTVPRLDAVRWRHCPHDGLNLVGTQHTVGLIGLLPACASQPAWLR